MAVVVAGELHDLVTAGEPAGKPHRAHRRLGAAAHHPHLLDARHRRDDQFGEVAFSLRGRTVARALAKHFFDRCDHARMTVAEYHRAPRADVVEIHVAVDVGEPLAERTFEKNRLAADAAKSTGGRVHAARDEFLGAGEGGMAAIAA